MKKYKLIYLATLILIILVLFREKNTKYKLNTVDKMNSLISILKSDLILHKNVESPISDKGTSIAENALGIKLPPSYKHFLNEFGNGVDWLYHVDQPLNGVNKEYGNIHWLGEYRKYLGDKIESDGFGTFETGKLLCVMSENSNGGAWVFITTETNNDEEWPLAFYNNDNKLYYKVSSFIEWLEIATTYKEEVIRQLDVEYRLGLG